MTISPPYFDRYKLFWNVWQSRLLLLLCLTWEFENKFFGRLLLKIDKKNRGIIQLYIIYDTCLSFYAYNYENGNEINTEFQYFK